MNKDFDRILRNSITPDFTPGEELNMKIVRSANASKEEKKAIVKPLRLSLTKGLVAAATVIVIGSVGVYAATVILNKIRITDNSISVGSPDLVDDEVFSVMNPEGPEYPGAKKDTKAFDSYEKACEASSLGLKFKKTYEMSGKAKYTVVSIPGNTSRSLEAVFKYKGGAFFVVSDVTEGGAENAPQSYKISLENTSNRRTYKSNTGVEYELVDGTDSGRDYTYVMISASRKTNFIQFAGLSDANIHEVLDSVDPASIA